MNVLTLNCRRLNNRLKRNSIKKDIIVMSARNIYNGEKKPKNGGKGVREKSIVSTIHLAIKVKDKLS